jgi:valacyclovir hydrolase
MLFNMLKNSTIFKNVMKTTLMNTNKTFCTAIQEQSIKVKGQTINYVKTGDGNRTILCFPGALGTIWSDFKPQLTNLDKTKFTIIAWDPPGYGHSRPPERNFNIKFYEEDADTAYNFMNELGINKFSLLGWSDGGISSMIISAKYPDAVDKLVIWGANAYILPEEIKSYEALRDISKWSDKMKAPLIKLYTEEGLQKMWSNWCDAVNEMYEKNNGNVCKEVLDKIKCPTLILHGDQDPMVASVHPSHLVSSISGSKLHRFPEGKHNIHLRFAKEFNDVVSEFLSQS